MRMQFDPLRICDALNALAVRLIHHYKLRIVGFVCVLLHFHWASWEFNEYELLLQ